MTTETATALPIDLPEITDEMVEYARSRATGLRSLAVGIRAALLASIPQWQPIEPDQIRAGMRIRVTVHREDCTTIYVGVAHRGGAYWCTEHGWPLTGWNYPTICEVDPSTIPADPDADLIELRSSPDP